MTVPADPPDAEILAEYQRRIDQGEPVPSQRHLVEAYGMGFPRARRLVEEMKRRKAVAALAQVQASGDGAVAELATEVIGRIHQHAVAADPAQSVQGAPGRTEGAPAGGEVPVQGAPGRTEGAPADGAEPVHRTGEVAADPAQSVQGAPATGELAQQPRPANNGPSPGDHTSPGMNGRERPFQAPLGRMLAHDAVEIAAGGTEAASMSPAPGRTEGAPADGAEPVHRTGEVAADPAQSVQGAPGRTEGAPVDVEPAPTAPQAHRSPVQGAPPRTAGGAERTGSEDQTGAAAPPVHRPAPQGAPLAGAAGAAGAVRPGALVIVLWVVGAAVAAAAVTRAVQTPIGQRVWGWLAGAVGADAVTVGVVAGGAGLLAAVVGVGARMVSRHRAARGERAPLAPRAYLVSAIAFMGLSVDTTLRFFRQKLGITDWWELALIFGGMELGLLACGIAMREAVRRGDPIPASAQTVAWGLAALAGTTGLLLSGWPGGLVRAAGPALAMVMLHLALGVELRHAKDQAEPGALARVAAELRERALSRLGLADEGRTAVARSRRRAARRAARLALQEGSSERQQARRDRRLQEALAKADVAGDAEARRVFLDEVEVLRAISSVDGLVKTVSALGQDT